MFASRTSPLFYARPTFQISADELQGGEIRARQEFAVREKSRGGFPPIGHTADVLSSGRRDVRAVSRTRRQQRRRDERGRVEVHRSERDVSVLRISQMPRRQAR